MSRTYFITGTDTGCGKTTVTCQLAQYLDQQGHTVACFKPVASGCQDSPEGLRNGDALALMESASAALDYATVNPYPLAPAIAPHIAAAQANIVFDLNRVRAEINAVDTTFRLIEGFGGWAVPLDDARMQSDLAGALTNKVILVVGLRLGCINHALLTARAVAADGFELVGWLANQIDPEMAATEENVQAIEARIDVPLLGRLDYQGSFSPCRDLTHRLLVVP